MDFEQQFEEVRHRVKTKLGVASGCHTLRVLHNAELLAEKLPEADRKIVRLAALLHDFARPEEMASKGKICHALLGAELVRPLLAECGFSGGMIEAVSQAVLTHRYRAASRHSGGGDRLRRGQT